MKYKTWQNLFRINSERIQMQLKQKLTGMWNIVTTSQVTEFYMYHKEHGKPLKMKILLDEDEDSSCNFHVAVQISPASFASKFAQFANLLCAQANSASYPQRYGKWLAAVFRLRKNGNDANLCSTAQTLGHAQLEWTLEVLYISRKSTKCTVISNLQAITSVLKCHGTSCHATMCHEVSWHVMSRHDVSRGVMARHVTPPCVMKCHDMSCHTTMCHEVSWHVMSCHALWPISRASK